MKVSQALLKDRYRFQKRWQTLKKEPDDHPAKIKLLEQVQRSSSILAKRLELSPSIDYPDLPISEHRLALLELLKSQQVVIVAGETGSGKTTQLPKICLEAGFGRKAMIAHTQPRRVAAQSVARRISDELNVSLGQEVGCQVRFNNQSSEHSLVKLMTDGVLLAEIAHDRYLNQYDCIIIDEAHERSLNIDFLLGYIKRILPKRPDLKVVITSATIDVERFSKHFNNAPVVKVSGRTYPVDMVYQDAFESVDEAVEQSLAAMFELEREKKQCAGDVLVFLPGEKDIRELSNFLRKNSSFDVDVLPLYSRLSSQDQQRIFKPKKQAKRRVVLATNVAETSLTVPGIRYVIDTGLARVSRYSTRSKVQQLPIEKISKASCNQRAGRCGRTAPGVCFRLFSEEDFNNRPDFTEPEIQRTNLASVILQMQTLGMGHVGKFPFLQMPEKKLINDGYKQLFELGALDAKQHITSLGKQMARLPIDPKFARILIASNEAGCLKEMLVIVSSLATGDVRETPSDKKQAAREKHQQYQDKHSDFLTRCLLFDAIEENRQNLSNSVFKQFCQQQFLSIQRIFEWRQLHFQLSKFCQQQKFKINQEPADYATIHRCLLTGFTSQVAMQVENKRFQGARNREFMVFPASPLSKKPPKWIIAAELLQTSALFAHTVAAIEPQWISETLSHLIKRQHSEPHYSKKQGQVLAFERGTLFGLTIYDKKRVNFSSIDKKLTREIFIREALVEENLQSKLAFYRKNSELRAKLHQEEERLRKRDILISDDEIFDFYDARLPENIVNARALTHWFHKVADTTEQQALFASEQHWRKQTAGGTEQFPDSIHFGDATFGLQYQFAPGTDSDGISVLVPVTAVNRLPQFLFQWLVPGVLPEKCEAMLKTLPKKWRKPLFPIVDSAKRLLPHLQAGEQPLASALCQAIKKEFQLSVPFEAFDETKLDAYYQMNICVMGKNNKLIEQSRDLAYIKQKYADNLQKILSKETKKTLETFKAWEFGDLPEIKQEQLAGSQISSFTAVNYLPKEQAVAIEQFENRQQAASVHRQGLCRLAQMHLKQAFKYLHKQGFKKPALLLQLPKNISVDALKDDWLMAAANETFFSEGLVYKQHDFEQRLQQKKGKLTLNAQNLEAAASEAIETAFLVRKQLADVNAQVFKNSIDDISEQLNALLNDGFIFNSAGQLPHFGRYLKALLTRIERLQGSVKKEHQAMNDILPLQQQLSDLLKAEPEVAFLPQTQEYYWQLQELRVSIFAQELKTPKPVSIKRLKKLWQQLIEQKQQSML